MKKSYWQSLSLSTARDRQAAATWFHPLSEGMTPYKAEILCDIATDANKKLRVLMKDGDGKAFKFERTYGRKRYTVTRKPIAAPVTSEE